MTAQLVIGPDQPLLYGKLNAALAEFSQLRPELIKNASTVPRFKKVIRMLYPELTGVNYKFKKGHGTTLTLIFASEEDKTIWLLKN